MFWGLLMRVGANELPGWRRAHPRGCGAVAAPLGVGAPLCSPPLLRAPVHHAAHTTPVGIHPESPLWGTAGPQVLVPRSPCP